MAKFDHVTVKLTEMDGNAFAILGRVKAAMRKAGVEQADIDAYINQAMSGDYRHLLNVTQEFVNVE